MRHTGPLPTTRKPLVRDLPDVPARVAEACSSYPPWPVHRAVQQHHTSGGELGAQGIYVLHLNGEHHPRAGLALGHFRRCYELIRLRELQQVDKSIPELEHG